MPVDLTLACGESDLTEALADGSAEPQGVNLTTVHYPSPERHWRMIRHQDFDVCEMSMSSYLTSRSDPERFPFTAITVFPHRRFRHSYMYKNADAGVADPGDFEGGNVGLRTWQTTAGVWMRGIAQEHYGLDLESVTWYTDDTEDVPVDLPDRFDVRSVPDDTNLERMLIDGDLDGAMYPATLDSVMDAERPVERVFEDAFAEERAYYEETGLFPLMHTVAIRDAVLEAHPWVAVNVYQAFSDARDRALEKIEDPRWTALVWAREHLEEQQALVGDNPWPFGLTEDNRRALDTLLGYAEYQGLIPRQYDHEELFFSTTLDPEIEGKEYVSADDE